MPGRRRSHVFVDGDVQGVFFRATCAREARARGLAGWVRNLPDGRVEAVFEGDPAAIAAMVAWCRGGPPHARVTSVEDLEEPAEGLAGFDVRHG
jgi:acylphosphatase